MQNEDKNKPAPANGNSPENGANGKVNEPIEGTSPSPEDAEYEKEFQALESGNQQTPAKPQRTELEKATFTAKSTLKRIKELGGNVKDVLGEDAVIQAEQPTETDTSQFVTKIDFARQEASKLARTQSELKLIMWWVENKGLSVADAHYMANKGKILKTASEVSRGNSAVPANGSGGAGQATPSDKDDAPSLSETERQRLIQSGMKYDPAKKAYVGKKIQHRWDATSKVWVTERIS